MTPRKKPAERNFMAPRLGFLTGKNPVGPDDLVVVWGKPGARRWEYVSPAVASAGAQTFGDRHTNAPADKAWPGDFVDARSVGLHFAFNSHAFLIMAKGRFFDSCCGIVWAPGGGTEKIDLRLKVASHVVQAVRARASEYTLNTVGPGFDAPALPESHP